MNRAGWRRALLGIILFGLSWGTPLGADEAAPRYTLEAEVDVAQKIVRAKESVSFVNTTSQSLSEVYFHVYPHRTFTKKEKAFMVRYAGYFKINPFPEGFQSPQITIEEVLYSGSAASFVMEGKDQTLLKVALPQAVAPGETIQLHLKFTLKIPHAYGRLGWHENEMALSRWYPILAVLTEEGWGRNPFYPFHRPFFSEAAYYSVSVTVPQEIVVIHPGQVQAETVLPAGKKILNIESREPIREFSLALSTRYQVLTEDFEGITLKAYYLPGMESRARETLENVRSLMAYYQERFGPYLYPQFSVAPVHLGYGGEQMSNMIFVDTRVFDLPKILRRHFDFLIAHETGHQWFYNLVGTDEFTQMWLEEGVNSYFILEYLESKYGPQAEVVELPKALEWLLPNFSFRRARDYRYQLIARTRLNYPVEDKLSSYQDPSSIFSITYGKGAAIVSMLRDTIGDEAFRRVFKRIFTEYRYRNLTTESFVRLCEEESGQDLKSFFEAWLKTTGNLDTAVSAVKDQKILIRNLGAIRMPVEVRVQFADGKTQDFLWEGQKSSEEIALAHPSRVTRVLLDPHHKLLDVDRTNNHWPRRLYVKPVPLYLGLYDLPLFLPEDSYNAVVGPELANSGVGIKAALQKPYDQSLYAATDYEFGESLQKSRLGYQLNNLFHSQLTGGVELFNTTDYEEGEEDLAGGKLFLRQELWPVGYGLGDINDHVTLYLLRDRSLNPSSLGGREDTRQTSYLRKDEAIAGLALHLGRSGPYPDPHQGYTLDTMLESSGHFLDATQYFYRGAWDMAWFLPATARTVLASRVKYGWGYPYDKSLYELGGMNGLRGYDRKTLRGARMALGSLEYRFPVVENLKFKILDNIIGFDGVNAVIFADAGQSWFEDFEASQLKKDAGIGLRFQVNIGSFLEKVLVRLDAAQAIREKGADTHFWFGVGHAF